jgi:cytochrome b6-f complex iron-sulfur subunit
MAKKMSVEEILAAARAEKAKKAAAETNPSEGSGSAEPAPSETPQPSQETAVSSPEAAAAPASGAGGAPAGRKFAPGGKGMSMEEILAAARAKAGAAPAGKPAAKPSAAPKAAAVKPSAPAAEKPAPKASPAAASGDGQAASAPKESTSILAAVHKPAKAGPVSKSQAAAVAAPAPPAKKKLEVPPLPPRPDYLRPRPPAPEQPARRSFFAALGATLFGSALAVGFTSLAVTHLMWLLGFARYMFPNILTEPPTRFKVGLPDSLAPGQVETKYVSQFGVWIVRYEYEGQPMIYALKAVCTHLGCTPNWLEAEQKFKCPCHGSGFYKDGVNFEGPAPRPLERYAISLADDGQLLVDKSRTFQQELGQWKDPASYVPV